MSSKILVVLGHPQKESLCGSLAKAYVTGAIAAGAEVRTLDLGDLTFDPILWHGYKEVQPLEPDLVKAQEYIRTEVITRSAAKMARDRQEIRICLWMRTSGFLSGTLS